MWSRPRLVKPAATMRMPSSRRWSRPWLEASSAAWVTPSPASRSSSAWSATGSGVVRLPYSVRLSADHADGAEARRRVAGGGEDLAGEGGDRGLAAGAGDGDEMSRLARIEARRDQRQRPARLGGAQDRRPRPAGRAAPSSPASTATAPRRDRLAGKARAVGGAAGQRREQVAGRDRAAVGRKPADLDCPDARGKAQSGGGGKVPKMHRHCGRPVVRFMRRILCRGRFSSTPARLRPHRPCAARPRAAPPSGG